MSKNKEARKKNICIFEREKERERRRLQYYDYGEDDADNNTSYNKRIALCIGCMYESTRILRNYMGVMREDQTGCRGILK